MMTQKQHADSKTRTIAYWIVTVLLALVMFFGGIAQLVHAQPNVDGVKGLGYPVYLLTLLGIWKILGVIVLLIPRAPLFKEWAYAGFFFLMSGAVTSHIASGEAFIRWMGPLIFWILVVVSWLLRPASRRMSGNVAV